MSVSGGGVELLGLRKSHSSTQQATGCFYASEAAVELGNCRAVVEVDLPVSRFPRLGRLIKRTPDTNSDDGALLPVQSVQNRGLAGFGVRGAI
jgi:hypothetical protein